MVRLLHTSDWHAGRVWKGVHRLDELAAALDHLAGVIEREHVDVVLHSGDVFDSGAPSADAERLVFSFFRRVGACGARVVVVAGNHDSPARLEAWGMLAELVGVTSVGRPRADVIEIPTRAGGVVRVAAVPFASPAALLSVQGLADDEEAARRAYADALGGLVARLCGAFRPDAVNVLMAHTHLEGALFSGSERAVHLERQWAARADTLPDCADYVALGHIHRPQRVQGTGVPTFYAGSPLQLDFGEAGEEKGFLLVEAEPGAPARVVRVPYAGTKPLRRIVGTLELLERDAAQLREGAWLHVTVPLREPMADVNGRVRRLLPNALVVDVELPDVPGVPTMVPTAGKSERELYAEYVRQVRNVAPSDELMAAFDALCARPR